MVPFAKSVGGYGISAATGSFQPTNTIVDFFVEEITPTTGTFRVNFEDVEQGADHDMDAIARYHYEVIDNSSVTITVDASLYASGSNMQHMVILYQAQITPMGLIGCAR
jgi:type IV pilus assembly protein PilY1